MKKTKLLLVTDSPKIHTGLGGNCRLVFTELLKNYPDKYDIESIGWFNFNGVENVPWPIHNTNVIAHPDGRHDLDHDDRYSQKTFESYLAKIKPDIVWSAGDIWCFNHMLNSPSRNLFRLALYYTIDGAPYFGTHLNPGKSSEWGSLLNRSDEVIVWSEFGEKVLKDSCPELKDKKLHVIYHPTQPNLFKRLTPAEKKAKRDRLYTNGIPKDAFILGFIGRNQFRKQNYKMWEVMHYVKHGDYIECADCERITIKEFDWSSQKTKTNDLHRYEEGYDYSHCWYCKSKNINIGIPNKDILLWQHMNRSDPGYNYNLHSKMWDIEDRVIISGASNSTTGLQPEQLADIMSTWDGFLYLSGGEGFGIPAFEAQQCGLPIIYANYSSHADFAKHGGLPVRCDFIPEFAFGINRSIADTGDTIRQILKAYRNRGWFYDLGAEGKAFADTKSPKAIAEQWDALFTSMMQKPLPVHGNKLVYATSV